MGDDEGTDYQGTRAQDVKEDEDSVIWIVPERFQDLCEVRYESWFTFLLGRPVVAYEQETDGGRKVEDVRDEEADLVVRRAGNTREHSARYSRHDQAGGPEGQVSEAEEPAASSLGDIVDHDARDQRTREDHEKRETEDGKEKTELEK